MKYALGIGLAAVLSFASLPTYALDFSSINLVAVKKLIASGNVNVSQLESYIEKNNIDTSALEAALADAGVDIDQVKGAIDSGDVTTLTSIYKSIPEDKLAAIIDTVEDLPITP